MMICDDCGNANPDDADVCLFCTGPLSVGATVRTPRPPTPETPPPPPRLADLMVVDHYDRCNLDGVAWALLMPGMYDELRLATFAQILDFAGVDDDSEFGRKLGRACVGDWIAFKDEICLVLANVIGDTALGALIRQMALDGRSR